MKTARDVVVIGAALGGLTAIAKIASNWPQGLPLSVLIALNTRDQPARTVLQIIESYTHVSVTLAVEGETIQPRRIYVSPPNKHLTVGPLGVVKLEDPGFFESASPSIDRLFATAALVYGPRVIGIVLSGNSHDGVQGMHAVEAAGGVGIVQDPEDAIASRMPRNVIRNDHPHYCVKASEISPLVKRLVAASAKP
jgi:two-component system chemotaxis response regulator CheB